MKKKGFTLIELLAVIVILAIIALIAYPTVLNIIVDARESAVRESTKRIAKAAETHYIQEFLKNRKIDSIDLQGSILKYKGNKPDKGNILFDEEGKAYITMYMEGYCVERKYDGTINIEKKDAESCPIIYENEVADTCYSGEVISSYTIDQAKCELIISEEYDWYDETDVSKFCTKGELASDGWSLEKEIEYGYWDVALLEQEGIISNVQYETKCLSCFHAEPNVKYDIDIDACVNYIEEIGWTFDDEDDVKAFCTVGEQSSSGSIEKEIEWSQPSDTFGSETLKSKGILKGTSNDGVSVVDYKCVEGNPWGLPTITDVVMPTKINGEYVKKIKDYAFSEYDITSADLNGATKLEVIEHDAFSYNENLTEIKIPYSTKYIHTELCSECEKLEKIEIDNYIDSIKGEPWVDGLSPEVIWLRGARPLDPDTSGANAPILLDNMIPVLNAGKKWIYVDQNTNWYNYGEKQWANGVILKEGVTKSVGDEITDEDVALWYVWIPRYTYTIFNEPVLCSSIAGLNTTYNSNYAVCYSGDTVDTFVGTNYVYAPVDEQIINIKFEKGLTSSGSVACTDYLNQTDSNGNLIRISEQCTDNKNGNIKKDISTYTHPAFSFGDRELPGIWVAKYTSRLENNKIVINQTSGSELVGITGNDHYNKTVSIDTTYGTNGNNHIINSMEWGALAYLTQSKYGLGMTNLSESIIKSSNGNVTGIYFVGEYRQEYCAGKVALIANYDTKLYDMYTTSTKLDGLSRSKLGDAIKEVQTWEERTTNRYDQMPYDSETYLSRIDPFLHSVSEYDSYIYWNTTSRAVAIPPQR